MEVTQGTLALLMDDDDEQPLADSRRQDDAVDDAEMAGSDGDDDEYDDDDDEDEWEEVEAGPAAKRPAGPVKLMVGGRPMLPADITDDDLVRVWD